MRGSIAKTQCFFRNTTLSSLMIKGGYPLSMINCKTRLVLTRMRVLWAAFCHPQSLPFSHNLCSSLTHFIDVKQPHKHRRKKTEEPTHHHRIINKRYYTSKQTRSKRRIQEERRYYHHYEPSLYLDDQLLCHASPSAAPTRTRRMLFPYGTHSSCDAALEHVHEHGPPTSSRLILLLVSDQQQQRE